MPLSPATSERDTPMVSILMPVRNEAGYIRRSLDAVLAQDYPHGSIEILVVDGMSTDGTREIIEDIRAEHPEVRLIDNPKHIVAPGLNLGTAQARGEILVRVDGHCEIAPHYVSACVRHLLEDGVDGVGGSVETVGEDETARAIAAAMSSSFGVGGSAFRTVKDRTMLADTIPFPAYTRQIVDRAGPYDETLVRDQDDEYNYRIRKLGGQLMLAADVHSRYYSRATLGSLWRQYYGYGFYKVRVLRKHPRQMKARQFVPGAFVAWVALCLVFSPLSARARRLLAVTLSTYAGAAGFASWRVSSQTESRHLTRLPAIFAAMHVGYGAGFVLGVARTFWRAGRA